jgi:hypothetical protein
VFQTTVLLRYVVYVGFAFAAVGVLFACYILIARLTGSRAPGWSSLAIFTLTIGGVMIMSTGMTGLYVGKTFDQVRARPLSVFDVERPPHGGTPADAPADAALAPELEARPTAGAASGAGPG